MFVRPIRIIKYIIEAPRIFCLIWNYPMVLDGVSRVRAAKIMTIIYTYMTLSGKFGEMERKHVYIFRGSNR